MGQAEPEPRQTPAFLPAQNASSHGGYVRHVGSEPPIPRETCLPPAPTPLGPSAGPSGRPIPGPLPCSKLLVSSLKPLLCAAALSYQAGQPDPDRAWESLRCASHGRPSDSAQTLRDLLQS